MKWKEEGHEKPWKARLVDVDGKRRMRSFETKKLRDEWVRDVEEKRSRLAAGLEIPQGQITYDDLCDLYLANKPTQTSSKWFKNVLKPSRDRFGHVLVRAMRAEDIGRWLHGLDKAPKSKNHYLTAMRQVLRAGVEWGYLTRNPARGSAVKSPGQKPVTPILPFESWAEVEQVLDQFTGRYRALVQFAVATGLRPSELVELRWSDLHLTDKVAHVRGTKTNAAARTIYLSRVAIDALFARPRPIDKETPVFAGPLGGRLNWRLFRKDHWYPALKKAGLERRGPRQMRHTFATLALARGVPIETVSKLMGHESIEVTMRHYARWTLPLMERARGLLDLFDQDDDSQSGATDGSQTR